MSLPPITLTGHAQKEAWRNKVLPPVERLTAGVWSIPVRSRTIPCATP